VCYDVPGVMSRSARTAIIQHSSSRQGDAPHLLALQGIASLDPFVPVAKLHAEAPLDHKEQFHLHSHAGETRTHRGLCQLDVLPVSSATIRLPVLRNLPKLSAIVDCPCSLPALVLAFQIRRNEFGRKEVLCPSADFSRPPRWDLTKQSRQFRDG